MTGSLSREERDSRLIYRTKNLFAISTITDLYVMDMVCDDVHEY